MDRGAAALGGRLETVVGSRRQSRLGQAAGQFRQRLGERTIWTVSSTAVGGGVAEMLHVLLGYAHDLRTFRSGGA